MMEPSAAVLGFGGAQFVVGERDGCQWRAQVCGDDFLVVKSDHADVVGDSAAGLVTCVVDPIATRPL